MVGDVALHIPEIKWLISCPIITNQFDYPHAVEKGGRVWLLENFDMLEILSYLVLLGPEKYLERVSQITGERF